MSAMVEIKEVDTKLLDLRILDLHDALIGAGRPGDAATIFQDQSRFFLEGLIRRTPPTARKGFGAKQAGEEAIERDLLKIFTPVHEDLLDDIAIEFGANDIDAWRDFDGTKKQLKWDRIDNTGQGMANFHKANLNARGRTFGLKEKGKRGNADAWYSPYVVTFADFKAYADKMKSKVGRRKAAWGMSLISVGGKLPNWISKHVGGAKGVVQNNLQNISHPSIVMTNYSPGISSDNRIVQQQVHIRASAIKKLIKGVLSGYSSDWKQGIKIQKQARKTAPQIAE